MGWRNTDYSSRTGHSSTTSGTKIPSREKQELKRVTGQELESGATSAASIERGEMTGNKTDKAFTSDSVSWLIPPIALLAIQQIFWRTPYGAVLQGIILGLVTSLVAIGIVLIYRSNKVLNFAQAELGLLPTVLSVMLIVDCLLYTSDAADE